MSKEKVPSQSGLKLKLKLKLRLRTDCGEIFRPGKALSVDQAERI